MAVFRCKMCGGTLDIAPDETVAVCEYCGTKQTLPKLDDSRKANLYDRANHFRRNNEFDKAEAIYEQILEADNADAEAYWSLFLCRYGIEYVEDPKTHKRVPTINRAQYTPALADDNYKAALKYADGYQKEIYEAEAREIDSILKGILSVSQKEEPFDVFICYKETGADGRRTPDSVLANELYHRLTNEGFKTFFAKITLENKLGTAYEPYIFAALNSSKVMIVLGTKPEYFNAPWVKNEWNRFIALIKGGADKTLIPAYKDMDPYDLPDEFAHLQAQDMGKLGFVQDIIHGISKIAKKPSASTGEAKEKIVTASNNATLLRRVFMFLEDKDWARADEYAEKVLDAEPENAEAYIGKLLAELRISKRENLSAYFQPIDNSLSFRKAYRFGNEKLRNELKSANDEIKVRLEKERLKKIYDEGVSKMNSACSESDYIAVAKVFETIPDYNDSKSLAEDCYVQAENAKKNEVYYRACNLFRSSFSIKEIENAISAFNTILDWNDASSKINECYQKIEELKVKAEQNRVEAERRMEIAKKKRKRNSIIAAIGVAVAIVIVIIVSVVSAADKKARNGLVLTLSSDGTYCVSGVEYKYKDSTEVIIPESYKGKPVTTIRHQAFMDRSSLTSVTIPDSVTSIGGGAFYGCSSLTSVVIPDGVTSIGDSVFRKCSSLTSVTIPDSVTSIGDSAFSECPIEYARIPTIAISYIKNSKLKEVVITSGDSIGGAAFYKCSSLTSVVIPNNITSIGERAFYDCTSLMSVTIPDSVTSIGDSAFYECTSLRSVTIGNSVTSIGYRAFDGCKSLTSVVIPDSVTSIGDYAFYGCSTLTSVTIGNSVSSIGRNAFSNCSIEYARIPALAINHINNSKLKEVVITSGDSIGDYAFYRCQSLTSVVIDDSVKIIGNSVFSNCTSLTSVVIPDSVTSIGSNAFYNCESLSSVVIPDSVTSIGDEAFRGCTSLTSVTIGDSVTSIGSYAFSYCSSLTTINFTGTKEEWNAISKGDNWNMYTGYYTLVYNYVEEQ